MQVLHQYVIAFLLSVIPPGITNFSEMLLKFKQWNVLVRALLRLAPVLLKNPQSMVL